MSVSLTGGRFKGTALRVPASGLTRPTSGKVRQALFNVLRGHAEEGAFLDLYAGSGSVGLEALGRGCRPVMLVEQNPAAFRILEQNCRLLLERGADEAALEWTRQEARAYCRRAAQAGRRFRTIFADPPFRQDFTGLWPLLHPLLEAGGKAVVQFPTRNPPAWGGADPRILVYGESSLAVFDTE